MKLITKKSLLKTIPFDVEEVSYQIDDQKVIDGYYRLSAPDWVNVLPVTADGRAILIRQPRVGSVSYVLETPGGAVDDTEKDVTLAAARELEEETGLVSQRFLPLGTVNPNPAIMTNRCHFFLALNCVPALKRMHFPDTDEQITLEFVAVSDLENLVRTGQVNHALACLCVLLASRYLVNTSTKS